MFDTLWHNPRAIRFVGAFIAVVMITFLAPRIASFALRFGPPEFFAVYLLTFCSFVGTGKDPFKTIIAMMLGFGLFAAGTDLAGALRFGAGRGGAERAVHDEHAAAGSEPPAGLCGAAHDGIGAGLV